MTLNDRLTSAIKKLIRNEIQNLTFLGPYEYSIQKLDGPFACIDPTDTTLGLPSIDSVELRPSLLGEVVKPTVGSIVIVQFVNGSASRPMVTSILGSPQSAVISTSGDLSVSGGGKSTVEHVMTLEATVLLIYNVFYQYTLLGIMVPIANQPLIAGMITAALAAQGAPAPPGLVAQIALNASLASGMASGTVPSNAMGPLSAGISVLASKTDDVSGFFPSLGSPQTKTG